MKTKKIFIIFAICGILSILAACGPIGGNTDQQMAAQQEKLMQEGNAQIGLPAIVNFQERKLMKMIFELRDQENLVCYAYTYSDYAGKFRLIGKCLGYGLPYSTQYTNPQKTETYSGSITTIPQADPNGLFMPESAEASWIMLLDEAGVAHPMYCEPKIVISPFELPANVVLND